MIQRINYEAPEVAIVEMATEARLLEGSVETLVVISGTFDPEGD